jgi:hypothetical protein
MAMQRPTAVLTSLALHGTLAAALLQMRYDPGALTAANVVYAELVRLDARAPAAAPDPTPRADEPPPLPASPPATAQPPTPPVALAGVDVAPPVEPPAAAAPPPRQNVPAEAPQPSPPVAESPAPEPLRTPVPIAPEPLRPAPATAATPAEPMPVPIPAPQQDMLAARFTAWTGRASAQAEPTVWKHDGREYTAVFRPLPAEDSMGIDRLIVEISTEDSGRRVATELTMQRLAFSSFAQFVDRWDAQVQIHDDEIDGRFHSNSEINVLQNRQARPIFRGRVTTASRSIRTDSLGRLDRKNTFLAGLETGVRKIVMPQRFVPFQSGAPPPEHTREFTQDTRIVFRADGSYSFATLDAAEGTVVAIGAAPHYLLAADEAELYLRGVVKGRVLVYSPRDIVIEGDLTYSERPSADPAAGDYLGLVSDRTIAVAGPDVTGPGDLTIHASIFAKRQFAVREFRSRASGTLRIYGSVSAGSVTATEPRYATKIQFDERLERLRAPGFPLTDRYELESWDAAWRPAPQ